MEAEQSKTRLRLAVELHVVGADGAEGELEVIFVQETIGRLWRANTPDLVIVGGELNNPVALARAVQISGRQTERVLRIAMLQLGDNLRSLSGAELRGLYGAFDAVFVVDVVKSEQLVRRLVRAITTPGAPDQWIGCDWNDVCYIVKGAAVARPAHYGFGRSLGEGRATAATIAALSQIASQGAYLLYARGLCVTVTAARAGLYGREIKEVMLQIRAKINSAATVVQCIGYDSFLDDGTMEVDVFAFGECDAPAPTMANPDLAIAPHGTEPNLNWRDSDPDPLYHRARSIVLSERRVSISLVQRHLRIGYQRAFRLLDAMEGDILSAKNHDGMRTVVVA